MLAWASNDERRIDLRKAVLRLSGGDPHKVDHLSSRHFIPVRIFYQSHDARLLPCRNRRQKAHSGAEQTYASPIVPNRPPHAPERFRLDGRDVQNILVVHGVSSSSTRRLNVPADFDTKRKAFSGSKAPKRA